MDTPPQAVGMIGLGNMGVASPSGSTTSGRPIVGFDIDLAKRDARQLETVHWRADGQSKQALPPSHRWRHIHAGDAQP